MLATDKFWFMRCVVKKIISGSDGGTPNFLPKAFSASKRCLAAVAYPDWVSIVTLELKTLTAFSNVLWFAPSGKASLESLSKGCGVMEYFGLPLFSGRDLDLFLLSKSRMNPFLFPSRICI